MLEEGPAGLRAVRRRAAARPLPDRHHLQGLRLLPHRLPQWRLGAAETKPAAVSPGAATTKNADGGTTPKPSGDQKKATSGDSSA